MKKAAPVTHFGQIVSKQGDKISVMVLLNSSCGSCHSQSGCIIPTNVKNIIHIKTKQSEFKTGDKVKITVSKKFDSIEQFFKYFLPAVVLIASFFIVNEFNMDFNYSVIIALSIFIAYLLTYRFFLHKVLSEAVKYSIE